VRRRELEERLLTAAGVADCVVLDRGGHLVAYVAPRPYADLVRLRRRTVAALVSAGLATVVPVRRIPRLADGGPDLAALLALPVLTAGTIRAYAAVHGPGRLELRPAEDRAARPAPPDHDAPPAPVQKAAPEPNLPPALVHGGPLNPRHDDPLTVTEAVRTAERRHPDAGVRVLSGSGDRFAANAAIAERARHILGGLRSRGLAAGSYVILQVPELEDYFPALWACLLGGVRCVTVAAPPAYDRRNAVLDKLVNAWRALGRPPVVGRAELAGVPALYEADGFEVVPVAELERSGPCAEVHPADPSDVALLQLSSGSTGQSKVIQITHRAVIEMALGTRERNRVAAGDTSFNWLPLDHVGSLVMFHLRDVILGCTGVHAPTAYVAEDPLRWLDALERYRVNHSWSPNFGYRLVADALRGAPERTWDLSSVHSLLNAGEQCTTAVVRDFHERTAGFGLRPGAMVFAWGMAETATAIVYKYVDEPGGVRRFATASLNGTLEPAGEGTAATEFISMGTPAPGASFRIAGSDGTVLPQRTIGRLQVRSGRVTAGYLNAPGANAEAFTEDGWFDTGDLAFLVDDELVITGRAKDQIVINGANYYCHDVEDVCGRVDGVRSGLVAACGVPDERSGSEVLGVFYVPEDGTGTSVADRLRAITADALQLPATYVVPVEESRFPRTTSGKIQRSELVRRLLAGEFDGDTPAYAHRPVWEPVEPRDGEPPTGPTVVFAGEEELAGTHDVITVRRGDAFAESGDGYVLDPYAPEDWARLRRRLEERGIRWRTLLYLWSHLRTPDPGSADEAIAACGEHLAACCRALLDLRAEDTARLVTVSRNLYRITGDEEVCYPAGQTPTISAVLGGEVPGLRTRHVDLPGEAAARDLEAAMRVRLEPGAQVAWRDGRAYVSALERVAPDATPRDALERGGWYLVAGGAGGIGTALLEELAGRYDVRFLVVGRRPADSEDGALRRRTADITDAAALERVVAEAEHDWGRPLSGALHLADGYRFRLLADETAESWRDAVAAKVRGTLTLAALVRERPGAQLVIFSSLLGYVASVGCSAYGAGNGFAEAYGEYLRGQVPVRCIAWALWHDVGLNSANPYESAVVRRGVMSLTADEGRLLTRALLRQPPGRYFAGVDETSAPMRALLRSVDRLALERPEFPAESPPITDPYGVTCAVTVAYASAEPGVAEETPELARRVEEVFRTVVPTGLERGRRFYELGVGSLQMLQIHARLQTALGREIPKTALFEYPTITALAGYLATLETA
jgi:acyl-CoA synthetase (AMP-forming)/AMP-acid ligase II/NAD(P)-dependent dehydrogenase (short-subunit alcohol dehydrogenase family)/acyl carrier protein